MPSTYASMACFKLVVVIRFVLFWSSIANVAFWQTVKEMSGGGRGYLKSMVACRQLWKDVGTRFHLDMESHNSGSSGRRAIAGCSILQLAPSYAISGGGGVDGCLLGLVHMRACLRLTGIRGVASPFRVSCRFVYQFTASDSPCCSLFACFCCMDALVT